MGVLVLGQDAGSRVCERLQCLLPLNVDQKKP